MTRRQKQKLGTVVTVIAVIIIIILLDMGVITNFLTAFKSPFDISSSPPKWIFRPTLDNFRNVLGKGSFDFRKYLWNSFVIAVISSIVSILLTIPAAYSIVRYHGFGDVILSATMLLRLAPALAFAIPVFLIFNRFKLLDTKIAIIFMHTLFITPTSLLLFIGYIQDLPKEIEEAAAIDGANTLQILTQVLIPVLLPGIGSTAILGFITSWNEYLFSGILSFKHAVTATVGTSFFITSYAIEWGNMAAAITLSTIPTALFIFIAQKSLVRGMTAGAVKG